MVSETAQSYISMDLNSVSAALKIFIHIVNMHEFATEIPLAAFNWFKHKMTRFVKHNYGTDLRHRF